MTIVAPGFRRPNLGAFFRRHALEGPEILNLGFGRRLGTAHSPWEVPPGADHYTAMLLGLRQESENAVGFFWTILNPQLKAGIAIAAVPPHRPDQVTSGVTRLAALLARNKRIDASSCLVRIAPVPSLADGGYRDVQTHLESLTVRADHVSGLPVLLLDDLAVTGDSLTACRDLLLQAGASVVQRLTLHRGCSPLGQEHLPHGLNRGAESSATWAHSSPPASFG